MNKLSHTPRRQLLVLLLAGLVVLLTPKMVVAQQLDDTSQVLSEADIVSITVANSPILAAAIIDRERAAQQVLAEQARYGFVLKLDPQLAHLATPSLSGDTVITPSSNSLVLGAELQRHLQWGTDLSLRVEGQTQTSQMSSLSQANTLIDVGPSYGSAVRLGFNQPLLRGAGRDVSRALLNQAEVSLASAKVARQRVASEVLQGALAAFWELFYANRSLDIQRQSLELAERQRDQAAARVATGDLAPVELLTFESRVASLHEDLASAEAERQSRAIALGQAIGLVDGAPGLNAAKQEHPAATLNLDSALHDQALASSYRVLELQQSLRLAELQERTATDPLRPRLDVTGYVQAQGLGNQELAPVVTGLASTEGVSAMLGLNFELPLDSRQREAEAVIAHLATESVRVQLRQVEQAVVAEIDTAQARAKAAGKRRILSLQTLAIVRRQVAAEEARFATGSSTALDVSQAQDQLRASSLRELRARVDDTQLKLQILHQSGQLLGAYRELIPELPQYSDGQAN